MTQAERRDSFAEAAMGAILGSVSTNGEARARLYKLAKENNLHPSDQVAKMAFEQSDKMIKWSDEHPLPTPQ